ncbi:hypothetical protein HPB48_007569 [Haemaphysalis longicornis]|uniref:Acyltransferase 3 domain-containing protein n=1 Tax=Haemaphysalis longicornis TaxID=44386 RepID=A0A9J6FC67_HAELO|nr:hypothetical protein HPB48_007569 [Haemaphysalis longicornis]
MLIYLASPVLFIPCDHQRATAILWCVATACCLACVFNKYDWNRGEAPEGEWAKMAYAFGDKIVFSIALSWGVFACATGRGGIVNALLSWKAFVPLGRLSLGVYVIHVPFLNVHYSASRERLYYSAFALATQFFGVLMWSLVLSFFLFLLIEAPTGRLEKMFFSYIVRGSSKQSEKPTVVISYLKDVALGEAKKQTEEDWKSRA